MITKATKIPLALTAASLLSLGAVYAPPSAATGFGDMFSPGKWFGGNRGGDRYYDDDYYGGRYGGPGWGGPGWGGPYGGGPYGGGPYGGWPGGGWGGYPGGYYGGYGAPAYQAPPAAAPAPAAPSTAGTPASKPPASSKRIEELERRIQELESQKGLSQQPTQAPPASSDWPSAPAFRPMSKY